jgi:hypothetical protein
MGSRSLDATAQTEGQVVSRPLGSGSSDPGPGFSVDWRALAIRIQAACARLV